MFQERPEERDIERLIFEGKSFAEVSLLTGIHISKNALAADRALNAAMKACRIAKKHFEFLVGLDEWTLDSLDFYMGKSTTELRAMIVEEDVIYARMVFEVINGMNIPGKPWAYLFYNGVIFPIGSGWRKAEDPAFWLCVFNKGDAPEIGEDYSKYNKFIK